MSCPPELTELLETLYDLSPAETELLTVLCEEEAGVEELSGDLGRDRSTVQRYLSSLLAAGLVSRRAVVSDSGRGRSYIYMVRDKEEMKDSVERRLEEWEAERMARLREL